MAEADKTAAVATTTDATTTTDKGASTTTDAAAANTALSTAIEDQAADTTTTTTADTSKGVWPEDWHARMAGDDERELRQIKRYESPQAIWKKARALEARLSSGELRPMLPKDPKPEELAAWRKDNGIPEKPDGYDLKDLKIPAADKAIVGDIVARLHASNASPDVVRNAVQSYYEVRERQVQERVSKDEDNRVKALDTLNQEWGTLFRRNVNLVEGLLNKFPESVREALKSARLPDGTAIFNSADAMRGFAALALELNPAGIVVPASGGDIGKSAMQEYKDIQKLMREKRKDYDRDAGKQQRFSELIEYLSKNEMIDAQGNEIVRRKAA